MKCSTKAGHDDQRSLLLQVAVGRRHQLQAQPKAFLPGQWKL